MNYRNLDDKDEIKLTSFGQVESDDDVRSNIFKRWRFPIRYLIALVCATTTLSLSCMRFSLGMAMVCMTNHTAIASQEVKPTSEEPLYCPTNETYGFSGNQRHFTEDGPFVWSDKLQGIILSSYFWGYLAVQLPAGITVDKFSSKWIMAITIVLSSAFSIVIPLAAYTHVALFILCNIFQGVAQGFTYPVIYAIIMRWSPKSERAKMITIATAGLGIAQMITNYVSASLCSWDLERGWTYIFFLFGAFGIFSLIIWVLTIEDYPKNHKWVSLQEVNYIEASSECRKKLKLQFPIPWRSILLSAPLWSIIYAETIFSFRSNVIFVDLPTYMKVIMNFDIKQNGIINTLPYILKGVLALLIAFASDAIIASEKMSVTSVRKWSTFIIAIVASSCMLGVTIAGCHKMIVVFLFGIAITVDCLALIAVYINAMDLAPNFVGSLKGMTNIGSGLGNLIAPSYVGLMINNHNSITSWNNVFYLLSALNLTASLVFGIFGSGEVQPWNFINSNDNAKESLNNDFENLLDSQQSEINNYS